MILVADRDFTLHQGDVLDVLPTLEAGSVDCVITSPPYWGLRDYGATGQLGLEPTPEEYVTRMVEVFRQVRRVLAPYGTCWVNIGDSYASGNSGERTLGMNERLGRSPGERKQGQNDQRRLPVPGMKPKDLVGIPWRLAFALQQDGWYLRADVIWAKPNPMPESVTDRPTKAHEYVFLLTKQPRYWFDQEAVREAHAETDRPQSERRRMQRMGRDVASVGGLGQSSKGIDNGSVEASHTMQTNPAGRNIRSVWDIATQPYPEAHFATYPEELVRRCLLAGCPEWVCRTCGKPRERIVERATSGIRKVCPSDVEGFRARGNLSEASRESSGLHSQYLETAVTTLGFSDCGHQDYRPGRILDPFIGSGTTALVARNHGRHTIGIELSPGYAQLAARRLSQLSLLAETV